MEEKQSTSLEEVMEQLNDVVAKLESEELSLEESYQQFSKGIELTAKGNAAIDKVEKKIQILMEQSGDDEHGLS